MIDTSTTAGKIQVMQAAEDGKTIEYKVIDLDDSWCQEALSHWSWTDIDYRIKPQTVEEVAAEDYKFTKPFASHIQAYQAGAKFGAEWKKEQSNE